MMFQVLKSLPPPKNGREVLDLIEEMVPDVILLDINMPVLDGVETCKRISKKYKKIKVMALSMYDQQSYFKRMMKFGAKGYLLKNDTAEEIVKAIRFVMEGGRYVSPQLSSIFSSIEFITNRQTPQTGLAISSRELEVLILIAEGNTNHGIGRQLHISHHTVNSHRKHLLAKLDAKNNAELVKKAMEKGVL